MNKQISTFRDTRGAFVWNTLFRRRWGSGTASLAVTDPGGDLQCLRDFGVTWTTHTSPSSTHSLYFVISLPLLAAGGRRSSDKDLLASVERKRPRSHPRVARLRDGNNSHSLRTRGRARGSRGELMAVIVRSREATRFVVLARHS